MPAKRKLFIDASPLITKHMSGVGHMTLELLFAVDKNRELINRYDIVLMVPLRKMARVRRWSFKHIRAKTFPLPLKVTNILNRIGLLPPVDLWFGRGVYLFPNFQNFPLAFSKSITYIHDVTFKILPNYVEPKNLKMLSAYAPTWMQRADKVITVSETAKEEIIEHFDMPKDKVSIVFNGINAERFEDISVESILQAKGQLGIKNDYILFVSNIEPRKNVSGLIQGYNLLPKGMRERFSLVLIGGDGWNNRQILDDIETSRAAGNTIIRPSNYVDDSTVAALMAGAACLAHPAFYEGFGITPLEALASGSPIVIADIPVLREIFGDHAEYVDPHDPMSISEGLQRVLSNIQRQNEIVEGGQTVVRSYSWQASARQLAEVIESVS